jgi:hypothetical protein
MLTLNFRDFAAYPSEAAAAVGSCTESSVATEPTNTEHETVSPAGGGCRAGGKTFRINDVVRHVCYIKYFAFVCLKSSAVLNSKQASHQGVSLFSL